MAVSRGLADTSLFIAREAKRPILEDSLPEELAVSVITIGELRSGILAANDTQTRDRRLLTLEAALSLQPVSVDGNVASAWAKLRVMLRDQGLKMPVTDSWIAATAITLGVPVITQDHDFPLISELDVIQV